LLPGRNFLPKPYDAASVYKMIQTITKDKAPEGLPA